MIGAIEWGPPFLSPVLDNFKRELSTLGRGPLTALAAYIGSTEPVGFFWTVWGELAPEKIETGLGRTYVRKGTAYQNVLLGPDILLADRDMQIQLIVELHQHGMRKLHATLSKKALSIDGPPLAALLEVCRKAGEAAISQIDQPRIEQDLNSIKGILVLRAIFPTPSSASAFIERAEREGFRAGTYSTRKQTRVKLVSNRSLQAPLPEEFERLRAEVMEWGGELLDWEMTPEGA